VAYSPGVAGKRKELRMEKISCPYMKEQKRYKLCSASMARKIPDLEKQRTMCATDDYDSCATFLGHVLRSGNRKETETYRVMYVR